MADAVSYQTDNGIAVLTMAAGADGLPGALDRARRRELADALERAVADSGVAAVVLTGAERGFAGPVPLEEIAAGEAAPTLAEICCQIEASPKPVVAALRGKLCDGAVELALAARARLAAAGARLSLGDLRMGLIPGAGGTQRLPRLLGAGLALDLMLSGRSIGAESDTLRGLFRKVVTRNVVGEAVEAARALLGEPPCETAPGFADPIGYQAELAERRTAAGALPPEAAALFDCVEAAQLLPLEIGLAMEGAKRSDLLGEARARGLIHTVALERRQDIAADSLLPESVTVLGDGPLAFGLVQRLLAAGLPVWLAERRDGGAARLIRQVAAAFQGEVDHGRLDAEQARAWMGRLEGGESTAHLGRGALVIEACEAGAGAVAPLVELIAGAAEPDAPVLLTSGMTLAAGDHAALLGGRLLGLALHAVPQRPGLAELAAPEPDARAVVQAGALLRRMERQVVCCQPENGLIVGRLKAAMLGAAIWCVGQGAAPDAVDRALGWSRGPFQLADAEGLARQAARFEALGRAVDLSEFASFIAAFLDAGREGRATGRGVLLYGGHGASGDYDAEAKAVVNRWRGGGSGGALHPETIRRRVWSALFSAGMHLLERGTVRDAGDVDLAALAALGLPRASGGPLKAAELRGLLPVRGELARWQRDAPALWQGSGRLDEMVKYGRGFGL